MIPTDSDTATDLSLRALNLVNSGIIVLDAHHNIVLWNGWMVPRSARAAARVREHDDPAVDEIQCAQGQVGRGIGVGRNHGIFNI